MTQEINPKTNKYIHLLKLIIIDVSIIVSMYFILIITFWMLLGEGNGSRLYYESTALIILSIIFSTSSIPFFLKYLKVIKKEATSRNHIKLKNYKIISVLNILIYSFITILIILLWQTE